MNDEMMNCWSLPDGRYIHRAMETRMKSKATKFMCNTQQVKKVLIVKENYPL